MRTTPPTGMHGLVLVSWAALLTALVTAAQSDAKQFGTPHRFHSKSIIDELDDDTHGPLGEDTSERVSLNRAEQVKVVELDDGMVIVLDFKRSMTAVYSPSADACYMIGGIDRHFYSPFAKAKENMDTEEGSLEGEEDDETAMAHAAYTEHILYSLANDFPIEDKNVLPKELEEQCRDLPAYWVERVSHPDDVQAVHKRSLCANGCTKGCVEYCCGWNWFRCSKKCKTCANVCLGVCH